MKERLFDKAAEWWKEAGEFFGERPVQLIAYGLAAVLLIAALGYSALTANDNKDDINDIKAAFCSADGPPRSANEEKTNTKRCQMLFTKLIENPTPTQARRLREIVKETP